MKKKRLIRAQVAKKFAKGRWVGMLALEYDTNEAMIEVVLMDYIRGTFKKPQPTKKKAGGG